MHNYVPWMLACEEHSSGGTLVPPASVVRLNHLSVMQAAFVWNWVIVLQVWVCMTWSKKAKDEAEYYIVQALPWGRQSSWDTPISLFIQRPEVPSGYQSRVTTNVWPRRQGSKDKRTKCLATLLFLDVDGPKDQTGCVWDMLVWCFHNGMGYVSHRGVMGKKWCMW